MDVTSLTNRRAVNRWERTSVGDLLERVTWSFPDKEAIVGWPGAFAHPEHERLTYRQADQLASKVANGLIAAGLKRSERVVMVCENSVEALITKIAIAKAGLVSVPMNPALAPDVVAGLIAKIEPSFLVVDAELWPRVEAPFRKAGLRPGMTIPIGGGAIDGSATFAEFVRNQAAHEPDVEIHGDDIWQILFTSGTTSAPKGAMISHHASYFAAYSYALTVTRGAPIECDLKLVSFLPIIFHASDQIFTFPVFLSAGTLVIGRRPVQAQVAEAVSRERATTLWGGSPQMVRNLAELLAAEPVRYDPRSLKTVLYGWAGLAPSARATFKKLCGDDLLIVGLFGQTESISCYRFWPDKWPEIYERTAPEQNYLGVPNPILASTVMDENGQSLRGRPGVPGEAVYRTPAITAGYFRDPEATEQAFRGGWFHSGDSCIYDDSGLAVMVDRYKDIVKSGGENVSSVRVEAVLEQFPGIAQAAVIGLPHARWGEAVTAVVATKAAHRVDADALLAFCRERLAGFEVPKGVILVDAFPRTYEGGKVLKYQLRERYRDYYA